MKHGDIIPCGMCLHRKDSYVVCDQYINVNKMINLHYIAKLFYQGCGDMKSLADTDIQYFYNIKSDLDTSTNTDT